MPAGTGTEAGRAKQFLLFITANARSKHTAQALENNWVFERARTAELFLNRTPLCARPIRQTVPLVLKFSSFPKAVEMQVLADVSMGYLRSGCAAFLARWVNRRAPSARYRLSRSIHRGAQHAHDAYTITRSSLAERITSLRSLVSEKASS